MDYLVVNLVGKQKGKQSNGFIKPEEPLIVPPGEASGFYVDPALPVKVLDRSAIAVSRSATAITLIAGFQAGWFGPLLPSIALAHHLRLEQTGIMVSAVCAGGLTALASSRFVIARLDDLKVTLLATILLFTGFAGLGILPGLYLLTASAFCYGLGAGLNSIASHILFPRYYPDKVASALSKLNVFFGVGGLLGPVVVLLLFALKAQYNWIFALASLYTLGIGIYLFSEVRGHAKNAAQVKTKTSADKNVSAADIKSVFTHPILVSLAVVNFLYVGIETSLGAWVYTFLQRAEALNGETASAAVSMLWIGLTLGRMASTKACLRINPKYVTMAAMLVLTATIFTAATVHVGAYVALPVVLLIGFGLGPIFPTLIAQSAMRFPAASSATTTAVIAAGNFGGMLLPWLAGYELASLGAINFMLITGVLATIMPILFGLALFPIWHRRQHQG